MASLSGEASQRAGTVTFDPPQGQPLPALTPPGELPGPPAVPVKPVNVPHGLAANVVPSGPVFTKIVDDGTEPKPGKVHKKWKKL